MARLQAGGVNTLLRLVDAAREHDPRATVHVVTLSWRHVDKGGADRLIVANELNGAAFDLRPPKKAKKGAPQEPELTPSEDELCGLVAVGDMVVDVLLEDEHNYIVVVDGHPQGHAYARFAAGVAVRCLKVRKCTDVPAQRVTLPKDATCRDVLKRLRTCRTVDAMHAAAAAYHAEHLADRFP